MNEELILQMAELIKERDELLADGDAWVKLTDKIIEQRDAAQLAHAELVEGVAGVLYDDLDRGSKDLIRRKLGALIDGK